MRLLHRLLGFRRAYFLPSDEFEQYLKDALRQQETRSRWMNVACLDVLLPEDTETSAFNIEKTLKTYARTVMSQLEPKRYALMCAMLPEDAERHLDRIHRELRNNADIFPKPIAFNISLISFNCFIPVLEFDQEMDQLLAEVSRVGQNILLHEIVEI
jgi:translation elongation factor EF-1beta